MKKISTSERSLAQIDPKFHQIFNDFALSPSYFAKKMFEKEWVETDEAIKLKLVSRLRNKLHGSGRLSIEELFKLHNILLDMANSFKAAVEQSRASTIQQRKEKIKSILDDLNELEITNINDLKNLLEE